ncbi:uncharacterized protein LOC135399983 isoform X2 [Ornithodoros turicata]
MAGSTSSPYSSAASSRCGTPEGHHTAVISFISSAVTPKRPYVEQKRLLAQALLAHPHFARNGELLQTMEKGVIYPTAHLVEHSTHKLQRHERVLQADFLGEDYVLHQGIYEEIKQHFPNGTTHSHSFYTPPVLDSTVYIMAGFKVIDTTFQDVMEDSWKDWTGARSLYINLADDFGLHRFSLYRRMRPANDFTTFKYILLVECRTVTPRNSLRLLDFVSRFRVQRMTGYLSVYNAQKLGITGSSSYDSSGDLLLQNSNHPSNGDWWKQVEDSAAASSEVSESSSNEDMNFQERETSNEDEDEDDDDDVVFAAPVTPTSTPSPTTLDEHYVQRRKNGYSMMPIYENHVEDEVDYAILPNTYSLRHTRRKRAENNGGYTPPLANSTLRYQESPTLNSSRIPFTNGHSPELVIEDLPDTQQWSTTQNKGRTSAPNCYTLDEAIALASLRPNGSTTTDENSATSLLNGHLDAKAKELLELDEMLQNLQCAMGPVLSVGTNKPT